MFVKEDRETGNVRTALVMACRAAVAQLQRAYARWDRQTDGCIAASLNALLQRRHNNVNHLNKTAAS